MKDTRLIIFAGAVILLIPLAIYMMLGGSKGTNTDLPEGGIPQEIDYLSGDNLILQANIVRQSKGLQILTRDQELINQAKRLSKNAASTQASPKVEGNTIVDLFTELSGSYYSTYSLLVEWVHGSEAQILLNPTATHVGAWVSYYQATKTSKPVPYIVFITNN